MIAHPRAAIWVEIVLVGVLLGVVGLVIARLGALSGVCLSLFVLGGGIVFLSLVVVLVSMMTGGEQ
jgi:hypothetical protein